MNRNLLILRAFFFLLAGAVGYWVCLQVPEWAPQAWGGAFVGASAGFFVIALDMIMRGFSLRGLSSLVFGLFLGWLAARLLIVAPIFQNLSQDQAYLWQIIVYMVFMYFGTILALKGKDDFYFVVPFVRFVPQDVHVPLAVVDSSALIDGRIVGLCASKFMGYALVIPQFVLDELHRIADSEDPVRRARGRRGLETLGKLRKMSHLDLRINESDVKYAQTNDDKLIFLAQNLKAKLLTMDFNTAKLAEFNSVEWLNLNELARQMRAEVEVGDSFNLTLVKPGKESHQAVGFLEDGSMVVVDNARERLGEIVPVKVASILPSAGGRMIFASIQNRK